VGVVEAKEQVFLVVLVALKDIELLLQLDMVSVETDMVNTVLEEIEVLKKY
jgi:hypothetical protein